MKVNSPDTAKVKSSKTKVTISNKTCGQKYQIYAAYVIR